MASSRYCNVNKIRPKLCSTSALVGSMINALRKQSIAFPAFPLIRQKLPSWLNSFAFHGLSRFAFFSRFSSRWMLKYFKFLMSLFFKNIIAACGNQKNVSTTWMEANEISVKNYLWIWHLWMRIALWDANQVIIKWKCNGSTAVKIDFIHRTFLACILWCLIQTENIKKTRQFVSSHAAVEKIDWQLCKQWMRLWIFFIPKVYENKTNFDACRVYK